MDESQISAYLELFDLPDAFTEAQLKQAYHDLVQVWHPDKHSHNERLRQKADEKMKEINQAYEVLQSRLVNGMFRFDRSTARSGARTSGTEPTGAHQPPPATHTQPTESAPQDSPPPAATSYEPKGLSGNAFWFLLLGVMLLIVIVTPRGRKGGAPTIPRCRRASRRRGSAAVLFNRRASGRHQSALQSRFPRPWTASMGSRS